MHYFSRWLLLTAGSLIASFAVAAFLLPSNIAPSGVTGLAVVLQAFFTFPISVFIIVANIPIQILAYRVLNGWKTVVFTVYTVALYSGALEVFQRMLGSTSLTNDSFLSAVCGGVFAGVGAGLIYRAGGTVGGTSTIAQMVRMKYGMSLSTASLYSDSLVIVLAGLVIGWQAALYAFIAVFVNRIASNHVLEGPSDTATALIITSQHERVRRAVHDALAHGITTWDVRGTGEQQDYVVVMVTISRAEVYRLQHVLRRTDDSAFMTVLTGQKVYGDGFKSMHPHMPLQLDEVEA